MLVSLCMDKAGRVLDCFKSVSHDCDLFVWFIFYTHFDNCPILIVWFRVYDYCYYFFIYLYTCLFMNQVLNLVFKLSSSQVVR